MKRFFKKYELYIKIILIVVFLAYLVWRIEWRDVVSHLSVDDIKRMLSEHIFVLVVCIIAVAVNWSLEAMKWKILISKHISVSYKNAIQAVLMGIPLGMLTPQRVGEHGGRILAVEAADNPVALSASVWASIAQWIACFMLGIVVLIFLPVNTFQYEMYVIIFFSVGVLVSIVFMSRPRLLKRRLPERFLNSPWVSSLLDKRSRHTVILSIVLSLLRFMVFSFQFLVLLDVLGAVEVTLNNYFLSIGVFVVQSFIPVPGLLTVATRTEIALLLYGAGGGIETQVVIAAFLLWVINLLIPSFIGLGFILRKNFKNSLINEESISSDIINDGDA